MAETLTKLYDGKYQKRMLRREVIEVREPVLILFAGGIRNRILSLLSWEHVASGFLPRFIFITAESDIAKLRPLGPPTDQTAGRRDYLLSRLRALHQHYAGQQSVTLNGKTIQTQTRYEAKLSDAAWERYRDIEESMLKAAVQSTQADITTPTLDRLCKSGLKVAVLVAAMRQLESGVTVEERDIVKAFWYIEKWRPFTSDVLDSLGHTGEEKELSRINIYISQHPGCLRSEVMQRFQLNARKADLLLSTLEQRDLVYRTKTGRAERLYPFNYKEQK